MRIFFFIPLVALVSFSCSHSESNSTVHNQFSRFRRVQLPLEINACGMHRVGLPDIQIDTAESKEGFIHYCFFEGPGTFTTCVSLTIADCSLPLLSIYDKNGQKTDEKFLEGANCDGSTEMTCKPRISIRKDFSIFICDSVAVTPMDSCGNDLDGSKNRYVIIREGKIREDGKVELGGPVKKD